MTAATVHHETRPPRANNIDLFGMTHNGMVRAENEDQFLIASLHKMLSVHSSSLSSQDLGDLRGSAEGYLCMVADGVGGRPDGDVASGTAVKSVAQYVAHCLRCYDVQRDEGSEEKFLRDLQKAMLDGDKHVREEAAGTATTLTMVMAIWPKAYLIHVGDSRCYRLRNDVLELLSTDQTMAAALVEAKALTPAQAETSQWRDVLMSSLGGSETSPITVPTTIEWNDVMLLCTDGLTKHVTDAELQTALQSGQSAEQTVRDLVQLALDRGGSDNVTAIVGRLQ
ncbi:MAG: serine/threonine-protein phosphatase [Phycisphaerae bacterium]|nr:serine/threonine-protein phosphatase [Gemmatimonadaceae bacterium]